MMREYVDFDYDLRRNLTPAQKSKITRYFDRFAKLKERPHKIFTSANKRELREAQQYAQHGSGYPGFKVAFIPGGGEYKKENGKVFTESAGVKRYFAPITRGQLIFDLEDTVRGIVESHPDVKRWYIGNDLYETSSAGTTVNTIINTIESLKDRYKKKAEVFIVGLVGYAYKRIENFYSNRESKKERREKDRKENNRLNKQFYRLQAKAKAEGKEFNPYEKN